MFAFLIILFLAGCQGEDKTTGKAVDGDAPELNVPDTVVVVNGEEITQSEIDAIKQQAKMNESAIVEQLIAKELLLQEAQSRGLSVSEREVEMQLSQMLSQRGSDLASVKERLPEEQYSQLLLQQKEQIMLQELAKDAASPNVSEEQLRSVYEENKAQFGNATFEQVAPQLRQMMEQRSQQQALSLLAEKLRQDADVDYK